MYTGYLFFEGRKRQASWGIQAIPQEKPLENQPAQAPSTRKYKQRAEAEAFSQWITDKRSRKSYS